MLVLSLFIILIAIIYFYFIRPLNYWKNLDVPFIPGYPIVGNFIWTSLKKQSFTDELNSLYNAFPNEKCVGMFSFGTAPALLIRDPELLKQITIKDFNYFTDHTKSFFKDGFDTLIDRNLFTLSGNEWRDMRATLSPAFTGSKMRGLFNMMNDCSEQFVSYYSNKVKNAKDSHLEVELKKSFTRFTNDIIASAVFGVKCDSLNNEQNEFYLMGCKAAYFATWRILLSNFCPWILKFLNLGGVIPEECCKYFKNLVYETKAVRERENIIRPDILHLLIQAQKGALKDDSVEENKGFVGTESKTVGNIKKLDDDDIAAQAFLFFLGGFETTSILMCFTIFELALNPDIQERLLNEIQNTLSESNGEFSYDVVHKMKYLDMIVTETLRKWPPAPITDRVTTKNYKIQVGKKLITLEPGFPITVPIIGFHRDPQYYPNPEKFDPERFNDENKKNIKPLTFCPFGAGPRLCIGARFAVMNAKIIIFHMIKNFEVILVKNSTVPPVLSSKSGNTILENGFHVGLKLRKL
uniref:Cytochrome P450 CYP9GK5 n=1 Tax=Chrysoperla zastrowi sillemi TaxID=482137 RepID=A0A9E7Y779_9NEOP|nr:cytochrome P450 CYP9GK5 [Chrysoperla zastrowi sillemi]UZE89906.1 cytochrome P450 CYP9GK5 [Chrysoperla zastrowi sillemi]